MELIAYQAISIKYCVFVSVASVIHHAKHVLYYSVICGLSDCTTVLRKSY